MDLAFHPKVMKKKRKVWQLERLVPTTNPRGVQHRTRKQIIVPRPNWSIWTVLIRSSTSTGNVGGSVRASPQQPPCSIAQEPLPFHQPTTVLPTVTNVTSVRSLPSIADNVLRPYGILPTIQLTACSCIARFPDLETVQSALNFNPWQICSVQCYLKFSEKHSSKLQLPR